MSASDSVSHTSSSPGSALGVFGGLKQLLFDPDAFFERHSSESGWTKPVLIMVVTGLLGTLAFVVAVYVLKDAYPASGGFNQVSEGASEMYLTDKTWKMLYGMAVRPLVGAIVTWTVLSAAFVGLSWLYSGHGTFMETMQLTAWGFVPIAVANVLYYGVLAAGLALKEYTGILTAFAEQSTRQPPFNDPQANAHWVVNQIRQEPWFILVALVAILLTLYSGYLWAFAVKHARNIETDQAYKVVAVPVLGYVAILTWGLLQYAVL